MIQQSIDLRNDGQRDIPRWASLGVLLALLALGLRILSNVRGVDLDLYHEMALFREVLNLGYFPREDPFAFTPTVYPFVHHEWGTGAVAYFLTVTLGLGLAGLSLLRFALLAGIVACCVAVARRRGATGVELAVLAPLAILLMWTGLAPVRAHLFTFFLLALLLWFLELDRAGMRRWIVAWVLIFVVWLNLHAGVVVGMGMLGLYTVESIWRAKAGRGWGAAIRENQHLVGATAVTIPLLLVNTYGWDFIPYLWRAILLERPMIIEWQSLWALPNRTAVLPFWAGTVLIAGYAWWRADVDLRRLPAFLLLAVAAFVAFRSIRILPIYMVVWFAYVPPLLASTPVAPMLRRAWHRHARVIGGLLLVLGVIGTGMALSRGALTVEVPTDPEGRNPFPAGAVQYLEGQGFEGNVMTPFGVGAFVMWHLFPAVKVGLDSRYEVAYPPEQAEEAMRIYDGTADNPEAWREFMDRFPTDLILVRPVMPLYQRVLEHAEASSDPAWVEIYRDDAYVLFGRPEVARRLERVDRRGEAIVGGFP